MEWTLWQSWPHILQILVGLILNWINSGFDNYLMRPMERYIENWHDLRLSIITPFQPFVLGQRFAAGNQTNLIYH